MKRFIAVLLLAGLITPAFCSAEEDTLIGNGAPPASPTETMPGAPSTTAPAAPQHHRLAPHKKHAKKKVLAKKPHPKKHHAVKHAAKR
jgi:hypothetical protein